MINYGKWVKKGVNGSMVFFKLTVIFTFVLKRGHTKFKTSRTKIVDLYNRHKNKQWFINNDLCILDR